MFPKKFNLMEPTEGAVSTECVIYTNSVFTWGDPDAIFTDPNVKPHTFI